MTGLDRDSDGDYVDYGTAMLLVMIAVTMVVTATGRY